MLSSVQFFSQVSGTFAARKIVALGILGVRFGNGFTDFHTISPAGVTSKMRLISSTREYGLVQAERIHVPVNGYPFPRFL